MLPRRGSPAVWNLYSWLLVASKALLDKDPHASEETIRFDLSGNLCRCTGYDKIVRAVQAAGQKMATKV